MSVFAWSRRGALLAIALASAACAGGGGGFGQLFGSGLSGTQWTVVTALGKPVPEAARAGTSVFSFSDASDGRGAFSASVGCNRVGGDYRVDGRTLRMVVVRSTKMSCRGELGIAERRMIAAIGATTAYRISGDTLEFLSGNQAMAVLQRR